MQLSHSDHIPSKRRSHDVIINRCWSKYTILKALKAFKAIFTFLYCGQHTFASIVFCLSCLNHFVIHFSVVKVNKDTRHISRIVHRAALIECVWFAVYSCSKSYFSSNRQAVVAVINLIFHFHSLRLYNKYINIHFIVTWVCY